MMFPTAQAISKVLGNVSGRMLDVAAGHGLFGIVLAQANPDVKIVAQDWPKVLDVAKQHAAQMGVANRYSTITGDAFKVDLARPYDVVLRTNLLHHFSAEECIELLKRLRSAPRPGGKLVTLEFVPNEYRISPPMAATFPGSSSPLMKRRTQICAILIRLVASARFRQGSGRDVRALLPASSQINVDALRVEPTFIEINLHAIARSHA